MEIGFLSLRSIHQFLEKVAVRVEVNTASMRCVPGIE